MNDEETSLIATRVHEPAIWSQHRFLIMIGSAVVISLFLVSVGLALYSNSGAAQLDLSRPGYASVRSQASKTTDRYDGFSANGPIDKDALDEFRTLYDAQAANATNFDAYANDVLNEAALKIDAPSPDNQQ